MKRIMLAAVLALGLAGCAGPNPGTAASSLGTVYTESDITAVTNEFSGLAGWDVSRQDMVMYLAQVPTIFEVLSRHGVDTSPERRVELANQVSADNFGGVPAETMLPGTVDVIAAIQLADELQQLAQVNPDVNNQIFELLRAPHTYVNPRYAVTSPNGLMPSATFGDVLTPEQ